jgi:hypothetical protein
MIEMISSRPTKRIANSLRTTAMIAIRETTVSETMGSRRPTIVKGRHLLLIATERAGLRSAIIAMLQTVTTTTDNWRGQPLH